MVEAEEKGRERRSRSRSQRGALKTSKIVSAASALRELLVGWPASRSGAFENVVSLSREWIEQLSCRGSRISRFRNSMPLDRRRVRRLCSSSTLFSHTQPKFKERIKKTQLFVLVPASQASLQASPGDPRSCAPSYTLFNASNIVRDRKGQLQKQQKRNKDTDAFHHSLQTVDALS